ncbi:MAG: BamA/TamA family outer membrane protein, partial [Candidatus Eremiobacterota bacterium]
MKKKISLTLLVALVWAMFGAPVSVLAQEQPHEGSVPAVLSAEEGEPPADAGEVAPAEPTAQETPGAPAVSEQPAPSAPESLVEGTYRFSGLVVLVEEEKLVVQGKSPDGLAPEGNELDKIFLVTPDSRLVEGLKVGDFVTVIFTLGLNREMVVSSVSYPAEGGLLPDVMPAETAAVPPGSDEPPPPDEEPPTDVRTPRVVNIEVEGTSQVPTEEVLQVISTRIGDPVLEPRIKRDLQAIFDLGYFTDVRLDTRAAPGGVRLVFRVLENPVVNTITISGNQVVPTEKILELMETRQGKILNTRTLHADIQNINKYYNEDLGYLLSPTHITDLKWAEGTLSLTLKDGMVVQTVDIEGVTVFNVDDVRALVQTKPGELFNQKTIKEDSARIAELYEKNDYILDTIRPRLDPEKGTVTLRVLEAVVEEIRVEGNTKTETDTIMRNLRTKPGEVLQRRKIQKDLERLNNLGYFKKVNIEPEPGTEPGKVVLVLAVEEQKTGLATIGVGYAGGGSGAVRPGITGAISFSDRNLFGEGKSVSVQWQRGANISALGLSYFDPAINDNQDSIGVSLFLNEVSGLRQPVVGGTPDQFALYEDQRYGGTFTYGRPLTDDLRAFITLRRETIEILQDPGSAFVPVGLGRGDLNSIGLSALYDTRDDVFNPTVGDYANASVAFAGLGGSFNYTKYVGEARHYFPLGENSTLALRGWAGALNGNAPVSEFFFAGGTDTLRGYRENAFFGTRFVILNAEYRFPIGRIKFLRGAVFADAGNAWIPGVTPSKLRADAGVGLRIVFPSLGLGVIRI